MANDGWIRLHRRVQDHWLWKDPVKFQWWIDILITVNHNPAKVNIGNELIDCKRGQSVMSLLSWALRWRVSKDTARNFLKLLEKDSMIKLESYTKTTRLTVCKYDSYQTVLHADQTLPDPNNKNKEELNNIYVDFQNIFIAQSGKKIKTLDDKARKNIAARISEGYTMEDFENAIKNCKGDPYHIKNKHYLTPEFITRSDKLSKYITYESTVQEEVSLFQMP